MESQNIATAFIYSLCFMIFQICSELSVISYYLVSWFARGRSIFYTVVKVSRILSNLWSGTQKFGYWEIRGPNNLNNAPGISAGSLRGPEIYSDPPSQILYFNHWIYIWFSADICMILYSILFGQTSCRQCLCCKLILFLFGIHLVVMTITWQWWENYWVLWSKVIAP